MDCKRMEGPQLTVQCSVENRVCSLIARVPVGVVKNSSRSCIKQFEAARQLTEILVFSREVLDRRTEFAIALEVLGESRVGGDGLECRLPQVMVRIYETGTDDLPCSVDVFRGVGDGVWRGAVVDLTDAIVFDEERGIIKYLRPGRIRVESDNRSIREEYRRGICAFKRLAGKANGQCLR